MDNIERKKELCKFLKNHKCFTLFIKNFKSNFIWRKQQSCPLRLEDFLDNYNNFKNVFLWGFLWNSTVEGFEFWDALNYEFMITYNEYD